MFRFDENDTQKWVKAIITEWEKCIGEKNTFAGTTLCFVCCRRRSTWSLNVQRPARPRWSLLLTSHLHRYAAMWRKKDVNVSMRITAMTSYAGILKLSHLNFCRIMLYDNSSRDSRNNFCLERMRLRGLLRLLVLPKIIPCPAATTQINVYQKLTNLSELGSIINRGNSFTSSTYNWRLCSLRGAPILFLLVIIITVCPHYSP